MVLIQLGESCQYSEGPLLKEQSSSKYCNKAFTSMLFYDLLDLHLISLRIQHFYNPPYSRTKYHKNVEIAMRKCRGKGAKWEYQIKHQSMQMFQ